MRLGWDGIRIRVVACPSVRDLWRERNQHSRSCATLLPFAPPAARPRPKRLRATHWPMTAVPCACHKAPPYVPTASAVRPSACCSEFLGWAFLLPGPSSAGKCCAGAGAGVGAGGGVILMMPEGCPTPHILFFRMWRAAREGRRRRTASFLKLKVPHSVSARALTICAFSIGEIFHIPTSSSFQGQRMIGVNQCGALSKRHLLAQP